VDLSVIEYSWRNGFQFPRGLAAGAGKEMDQLREELGRFLDPRDVLDYARAHPESALHQCFDWDRNSAAEAHWLTTAGQILRAVKVRVVISDSTPEPREVIIEGRQNVHLLPLGQQLAEGRGKGYASILEALPNFYYREQMLQAALTELIRWRAKHSHMTELHDLFRRIDDAIQATGRTLNLSPKENDSAENE
jgi:hypothetical protein